MAALVLRKYKPKVVMVTGSVGKTSTKDAVGLALGATNLVRASEKSFNSELGVPLTVLGVKNPWNSPLAWVHVFLEGWALLLFPNHYPKLLVLEVGADHPGDLAKILKIATPDAVVVTRLPAVPVHVEAYATPDAVREEEFLPAYALAAGSPLVVSADDEYALALARPLGAARTTFGFAEGADVHISQVHVMREEGRPIGMQAVAQVAGKGYPLRVSSILGRTALLAPAAALAVAHALQVPLEDVCYALAAYTPAPGRGRLLRGVEDTVLIDDTYNASPAAVEEALAALELLPGQRHIAVLGDMLELGRYSISEHERIGKLAAHHAQVLITVGTRARGMASAAVAHGMPPEAVHSYETTEEATAFVQSLLRPGDAVLLKASQGIRLERMAEALLADPADRTLLPRQDDEWLRR